MTISDERLWSESVIVNIEIKNKNLLPKDLQNKLFDILCDLACLKILNSEICETVKISISQPQLGVI